MISAVEAWFPSAVQRFCCQHIFSNFKKKFSGVRLKNEFWAASKATTGYEFWEQMKIIKQVGEGKPAEWLLAIPLAQWARHAFTEDAWTDDITNNMTESFNSWVGKLVDFLLPRYWIAFDRKAW